MGDRYLSRSSTGKIVSKRKGRRKVVRRRDMVSRAALGSAIGGGIGAGVGTLSSLALGRSLAGAGAGYAIGAGLGTGAGIFFGEIFPELAEFAKEKGWRCGNSFISWRSKCYRDPASGEKRFKRVVNPKTGRTRKEPVGLTYKEYRKERSQALKKRGRGEALSDREQQHLGDVEKLALKTRKAKQRQVEAREKRVGAKQSNSPTLKVTVDLNEPLTMNGFRDFYGRLVNGDTTADEVKQRWQQFKNSKDNLTEEFKKLKKDELMKYVGLSSRKSDSKGSLVKDAVSGMEDTFAPDSFAWSPFSESKAQAIDREVGKWTDEVIQQKATKRRDRIAARTKALTNPESLEEYDQFVGRRGQDALTPEQRVKYDDLQASAGRQARAVRAEMKATVKSSELPEGVKLNYQQTKHTQKGHDLHVVSLSDRVEREKYQELNARAKKLGGHYSSYTKGGAIPGFQFKDKDKADQFMKLEAVSGAERVGAKADDRKAKAAQNLAEQAANLESAAEEKLGRDRLTNTYRRVNMAESAERQARRDLQIAATMSNLSKAIENEDVKFLDRIRTKADVEQLNGILVRAKHNAILKAQKTDPNLRYDNEALRPEREEDILQAEYPYPSMHKDWVKNLAQEGANKPGLKATSAKLMKRYFAAAEKGWRVDFQDEKDIDELRNYANRLKETGKDNRTPYSAQQALEEIRNYDRIKKLDITNATELRAALREFLQYRGEKKQADPIKQLERDLVGNKIEGFFPTPKDLADRVVRQADIKDGMRVLEPSAGSGALADAVTRAKGDKVELQTIEQQGKLADLLQAKGYKTRQDNFLDLQDEEYDRIIMNPPFENGQDIDHVQHAYNRLAPGGKLVAIMSEGPFFRGDKKASEFRDWLNGRGASEKLPEGSFKNSDRSTGVSTRLVTIEKPAKKSQESKLLSTPEVDPTPPTKSPTPELKLSDLKNSDDRLKYAQQELAEAKRSGDKKRVADWEEEEKRARMTRLKEDQKKQKEKQTSLFDPLAYDSNSPLLRALYSDEVSSTRFSILYPHLAEFRGGYECGGTFIPATRKCWTDPKSGAKLKVPFGYKEYTKRRASAWKKAQSGGQLDESDRRLIASTERLQRKVTGKKEKAELTRAAASAGARQILSSGIAEVDPKRVAVDAQRFQYKILGAQTKSGSVGSLSGVRKWDPNLAGIVQLWRDPKDGKSYVINGHNRLDLAKQLNVPKITAKFIKAQSPEEARAVGAMTNIAEGRGTPIDAAKFFRDSGLSKQDLDRKGIPMRERIATDGLALSKLSDPLFGRVVQGELPEQRAVTIGATLTDHQQQNELVKLIDSKEKRGKKIDNDTIQELSQMVADAPKKEESQGGLFDLLGFSPETRSLAVEKAQIQAGIKKQLARERKLFGTVGKSRAASELEKAGNKINVEESAEISEVATKALEAFDKEKNLSGRVSSALNRAAERLADGENSAKIQREVYDEVLANLQETYRFGKRSGSGRVESISERRKNQNQGDLFAASKAPFPIAQFGGGAGCTCEAPSLRLKRRGHKLKRRRSRQ